MLSVVEFPLQIVVVPLITGTGLEFTVTACDAVPLQLPLVTVTVYVVVPTTGVTVMDDVVEPSLQLYVPPPLVLSVVELPLQMVVIPLMVGTKLDCTTTC